MRKLVKLVGAACFALGLLSLAFYTPASAAEDSGAQAPQAAASSAAPGQTMGPGMMGSGMAARYYQMRGAPGKPGQALCPCRQFPGAIGPGMMGGGAGPGMMGNMDPKTRGEMMQLRGKYLKEMGELMEKRGKELETGK